MIRKDLGFSILKKKLNPDYNAQCEREHNKEKNISQHSELAMGLSCSNTTVDELTSSDDDFGDSEICDFMEESTLCSTPEVSDRPSTRVINPL